MDMLSVVSGFWRTLVEANRFRNEVDDLPTRLGMNRHRINSLREAILIAKQQQQADSNSMCSQNKANHWRTEYFEKCEIDIASASEVIDQAVRQIGDQAKVWRKLSSAKLISSSNLVKTEQKLQEMTNMLSFLNICAAQEAQLERFILFHDRTNFSIDADAILKTNPTHEIRTESPLHFSNADTIKKSIVDVLHTDPITNITNQHHQKVHNSSRLFLLKKWELIFKKRKTSIPFSLRVYCILDTDDAVFRVVSLGNIDEMLLLFTNRKASPFVRDVNGCSLLHYAACSFNLALCEKLLILGLGDCVDERTSDGLNPGHIILLDCLWNDWQYNWNAIEKTLLMFRQASDSDNGYGESDWIFLVGCSTAVRLDPTSLARFQQLVAPYFFQQPVMDLIGLARTYILSSHSIKHPDPDIFTFLIGQKCVRLSGIGASTQSGLRVALLHSAAIGMVRFARPYRLAISQLLRIRDLKQKKRKWEAICRTTVRMMQQREIHYSQHIQLNRATEQYSCAPHLEWEGSALISVIQALFIDGFPARYCRRPSQSGSTGGLRNQKKLFALLSSGICLWLNKVAESGMAMATYGRMEKELLLSRRRQNSGCLEYIIRAQASQARNRAVFDDILPVCLFDFEYHGAVENWHFHWGVDVDKLAGEFWHVIERDYVGV